MNLIYSMFNKESRKSLRKNEDGMSLLNLKASSPPNYIELCRDSQFHPKELKYMYRMFKQHCPNGYMTLESFNEILNSIFPIGDASRYAKYFYCCFDLHNNGLVEFKSFVETLSKLNFGTTHEKAQIIYKMYDPLGRGYIDKKSLQNILNSVYELADINLESKKEVVSQKADLILMKACRENKSKRITLEEFQHLLVNE